MSLTTLPHELLLMVASHLSNPNDVHSLRKTSRFLYKPLEQSFHRKVAQSTSAPIALIFAAATGDKAMLKEILELGPCMTIKEDLGPNENLHIVPGKCDDEVVDKIIRRGADLFIHKRKDANKFFTGPVLTYAAKIGNQKLVAILLENGADVHAISAEGRTALHYAAEIGHQGVVKLLLRKGADRSAKAGVHRELPLDLARAGDNREVVKLLEVVRRVTGGDRHGGKSHKSDSGQLGSTMGLSSGQRRRYSARLRQKLSK